MSFVLYTNEKEAIMVFIILQERVQPRQRRVRWGRAERQLQDLTSHVQVQPSCHNCLRASCPYKPTTPNLAISSLSHSTFSVATFKAEGPRPTPSGPFVTFYRCVFCISHNCQYSEIDEFMPKCRVSYFEESFFRLIKSSV